MTASNLAQTVYRHALQSPESLAVSGDSGSLSYSVLACRATAVAHALRQHPEWCPPAGRPARVGLLTSRSPQACVALLGACWAGATYVPIGLKQPESRLRAVLEQSQLSAILTDTAHQHLLTPGLTDVLPTVVLNVDSLPPAPHPSAPTAMAAQDTAYIIFTSGTTGVPKGVMIPLHAARHYIALIADTLGLHPNDRALETCETSFDFSVHNMFATWEAGASLHILPAAKVMNAVRFVRESGLTVWQSVPSLAGMLRQLKQLAPDSLPSLRLTIFGGEQLPAGTVESWRAAAPNSRIVNLYGPTEATVFCTLQPVDDPLPLAPGRDVVAIGTPLPGSKVRIVDSADQPVPSGTAGELLIGGVQLAEGYLNAPALTAIRFPVLEGERWYRSGDAALIDAQGHLHCLGRIDNQVKVLGYRVELEEIDAQLRSVSGIDLVGSVAWPLVDGMARGVIGFLATEQLDAPALTEQLKQRLPAYMVPTRLIALPRLPTNASGKVDRRALLAQLEGEAT